MKKLYLAASIAALMATSGAQAVEVFKQGDTTLSIGGYADINLKMKNEKYDKGTGTPESDSRIHFDDNSSRINFVFTQGLSGNWKAQAAYEMGFKFAGGNALRGTPGQVPGNSANDIFSSRVSYIAMMNDNVGSIYFGKNWSAYYEVGGVTDVPYVYAPVFGVYELGDGGITGTGRADSAIQYMHKIAGATIALQYQPFEQRFINTNPPGDDKYVHTDAFTTKEGSYSRLTYGPGFGLALKYDIMGYVELGFAYNMHTITLEEATVTDTSKSEDLTSSIMAFSLQHGEFGSGGFHAGFVFNMGENFGSVSSGNQGISGYTLAPEATGMELVLSYTVADFTPMIGYYSITAKSSDDRPASDADELQEVTRSKMAVSLSYNWTKNFLMYLEAGLDVGSKATLGNGSEMTGDAETNLQDSGTGFAFGMRMYL